LLLRVNLLHNKRNHFLLDFEDQQNFLLHQYNFLNEDFLLVELLKKFITERGKILPRRMTGLTSKQQRDLTLAVKRARIVALLPFVNPEG